MSSSKSRKSENSDEARLAESKRILERVSRESETVLTSSVARSADQFKKRVGGIDGTNEDNDPIEVLGKKIGRTLGWLAVIFLMLYLVKTYVF